MPLPGEFGGTALTCGRCRQGSPAFSKTRAVARYEGAMRDLILQFKHTDAEELTPLLGGWLAQAGGDLWPDIDVIVPVPLTWSRLWRRQYNQAALLANEVSRLSAKPLLLGLLKRHRQASGSQEGLTQRQRQDKVRGAFYLDQQLKKQIAGKRILLIDDVLTSGATLNACAKVLRRPGGAAEVMALVLARR